MLDPKNYEVWIIGPEVQEIAAKIRQSEIDENDGSEEGLDPAPVYWEAVRRWIDKLIQDINDSPAASAYGCSWEKQGNFSAALDDARTYGHWAEHKS